MAKVVRCGKCGKVVPNMIKLGVHIRKKHPGQTVDAIVEEEKEKS